ncbi:MAG: hypothetical protein ACFFD5_11930 [Candidatus Thorarchaeota archaeon]
MVNFLLLINKISAYSKKDIDQGKTPLDVYQLCSCIRDAFCLSYSIRKENNLYLYFQERNVLIKFEGKKLKFLSSDERSQALLLYKALNLNSEKISFDNWHKSTPGIYLKKLYDLDAIIEIMRLREIISVLIVNTYNERDYLWEIIEFDQIKNPEECLYIIPIYSLSDFSNTLINLLKEVGKVKVLVLIPIKSIENIILYINYKIDQIQNHINKSKK